MHLNQHYIALKFKKNVTYFLIYLIRLVANCCHKYALFTIISYFIVCKINFLSLINEWKVKITFLIVKHVDCRGTSEVE